MQLSAAFSSNSLVGATMVLILCERGVGTVFVPGGATTPFRRSNRYRPNVYRQTHTHTHTQFKVCIHRTKCER